MKRDGVELVLASGSPRRRDLLARLGIDFSVVRPGVDETPLPAEPPSAHVTRVATEKAHTGSAQHPRAAVLAADTVVVLETRMFGKPATRVEAASMLAELAGRTHTVLTATVLRWRTREAVHLETARVTLLPYSPELYGWYVATGEVDDKAGAYAVQGKGAVLVERVEGNVQAVIGLPLAVIPGLFEQVGLCLTASGDRLSISPLA
jgi:septum formation protein